MDRLAIGTGGNDVKDICASAMLGKILFQINGM